MSMKHRGRVNLEGISVNMDKPVVDLGATEFNDIPRDQFGRPYSPLYRSYDPPLDKAYEEGLKVFERLRKRHGSR